MMLRRLWNERAVTTVYSVAWLAALLAALSAAGKPW
jgi:hypothetical protein